MEEEEEKEGLARDVLVGREEMVVVLKNGRMVRVDWKKYPRLRGATIEQRMKWELIGGGVGIHWPDVDEDLSVDGLRKDERS